MVLFFRWQYIGLLKLWWKVLIFRFAVVRLPCYFPFLYWSLGLSSVIIRRCCNFSQFLLKFHHFASWFSVSATLYQSLLPVSLKCHYIPVYPGSGSATLYQSLICVVVQRRVWTTVWRWAAPASVKSCPPPSPPATPPTSPTPSQTTAATAARQVTHFLGWVLSGSAFGLRIRIRESLSVMRKNVIQMRSSLVVRASDCQCTSCIGPGFDPSIRRHSGIWGAADEAVLNIVRKK